MSGRYVELPEGRYTLMVPSGDGPAGIHRENGHVRLERRGGRTSFEVRADERVYFWWRGPTEPPGIRIIGPAPGPATVPSIERERERRTRGRDRRREPRGLDRRAQEREPDRSQERIA